MEAKMKATRKVLYDFVRKSVGDPKYLDGLLKKQEDHYFETAVIPILHWYSMRITKKDLWCDDVQQAGMIDYITSWKLQYSISQALVHAYKRMLSYYYRTCRPLLCRKTIDIVQECWNRESESFFDVFPVVNDLNDEVEYLNLLFELMSRLQKKDTDTVLLLITGYKKTEIAKHLNICKSEVSRRVYRIKRAARLIQATP